MPISYSSLSFLVAFKSINVLKLLLKASHFLHEYHLPFLYSDIPFKTMDHKRFLLPIFFIPGESFQFKLLIVFVVVFSFSLFFFFSF